MQAHIFDMALRDKNRYVHVGYATDIIVISSDEEEGNGSNDLLKF